MPVMSAAYPCEIRDHLVGVARCRGDGATIELLGVAFYQLDKREFRPQVCGAAPAYSVSSPIAESQEDIGKWVAPPISSRLSA